MVSSSLVSCDWLEEHLGAPDLVVLDCSWYLPDMGRDARAEYATAHIPGAIFFDIDAHSDKTTDLPHMLPTADAFQKAMQEMGIGDGKTVVVYDGMGMFSAARVWWTLKLFGLDDVFVLNGGLPKWKAENRPLTADVKTYQPAHFTIRFNHAMVRTLAQVQEALEDAGTVVLDARSAERFAGSAPEPRPGVRAGHMKGAKNLPFGQVLNADGTFKSNEELAAVFAGKDITPNTQVVTSCGSGVTASILALALSEIGHHKAAVYDGSWSEWGSSPLTEVVTGAE
ncbi:3-mercaptopyruvate sulfurtransferase [Rhodobacteraceae bacterium RKSG542]|uniref:3-mercaptopyruvate sulfurtransferase n=1 Tax=Pseudovibrio flavus TaxID=2529854 RepID=UPI0012BB9EC2|nr:3-mercaptopyruvate sulfurtransferase [Pseudovibrio flavus]MTI17317.1 3-mercaptopyruvate sulfurtransferase [Pseudovibrio flavus]